MTMRVFGVLSTDDKFVYFSMPDYTILAKIPCSTSRVLDLLTAWRTAIETPFVGFEEVPDSARELYTFHQEPGTDYYEMWNAYGRRVASRTIKPVNSVITLVQYVSMGRRMILDSLLSPAMPC